MKIQRVVGSAKTQHRPRARLPRRGCGEAGGRGSRARERPVGRYWNYLEEPLQEKQPGWFSW